jgi:hypothetical protein
MPFGFLVEYEEAAVVALDFEPAAVAALDQ